MRFAVLLRYSVQCLYVFLCSLRYSYTIMPPLLPYLGFKVTVLSRFNLPNFPVDSGGGGGVTIDKYFQRALVTRKIVKNKKHKNQPRQFICEDIKHDEG